MLALDCPHCAAPVPLAVGRPDTADCSYCGRSLPLDGDVSARLREAAQALERHGAAERQLHGIARVALSRGVLLQGCAGALGGLLLLPALPLLLTGVAQLARARGADFGLEIFQFLALLAMLSVIAGSVAFALLTLRRARRRLGEAAAAVPPAKPGDPARCRVCGAPLASQGVAGVVRCDYCAADNAVETALLARASARRLDALSDYAAEVERQSGAVPRAFGTGAASMLVLSALSPLLCGLPAAAVGGAVWAVGYTGWVLMATNRPPDPNNRYGLVEIEGEGRCVAWYNPHAERWERAGPGLAEPAVAFEPGAVEPIALDGLLGRPLRLVQPGHADHGFSGEARRPRWHPHRLRDGQLVAGADSVTLHRSARETASGQLWRLCLAEPEGTPRGPR